MKKGLLYTLLASFALAGQATPRSRAEAMAIAKQFVAHAEVFASLKDAKISLAKELSYSTSCRESFAQVNPDFGTSFSSTRSSGPYVQKASNTEAAPASPSLYIYNVSNGQGFVIVSADDRFIPVLGYGLSTADVQQETDNGQLVLDRQQNSSDVPQTSSDGQQSRQDEDVQDMVLPDGFCYWLDFLNREMAAVSPSYTPMMRAASSVQPQSIDPLLTTKWNQTTPYNNLIPTYATGCVATATAQVMKFWNYPLHGTGRHTNAYFPQYSADFSATAYDWANMKDEYGGKRDTKAEVNAVATLMYHLGVATDMYWTADNSSTPNMYAAYALVNYFGYNKNLRSETRDHMSTQAWKELLLEQLASGHPLCYSGMTAETSGAEGHFFVCDGYDASTDKFHFNWGWGGVYDGYFSLSALDPIGEGQAGALTGSFNYAQQVFVDVQPTETDTYVAHFDADDVFPLANYSDKTKVTMRALHISNNALSFAGSIGLAAYSPEGALLQYVPSSQSFPGSLTTGKSNDQLDVELNLADMADGTYVACLAVRHNEHPLTPYPVRAFYGKTTFYEMTLKDGHVTFAPFEGQFIVDNVTSPSVLEKKDGHIYNLQGIRMPETKTPSKGIYVSGTRKYVVTKP